MALDRDWSSRRSEGEEAFRSSYANLRWEAGTWLREAQQFVRDISKTSAPTSIMRMKRQVYKHLNRELGEAMVESTHWMDESLAHDDFKEGVASFVASRAPNFSLLEN